MSLQSPNLRIGRAARLSFWPVADLENLKLRHMNMRLAVVLLLAQGIWTGRLEAQNTAAWPHPVPARVRDSGNQDLWVMTLGDVKTPLAQGTFDPVKDELTLKDGTVM